MNAPKIIDIIEQGESQVLVLPPDVRLPGVKVEVSQSGDTVMVRALREPQSDEEIDALFARIDGLVQGRFMEEGRQQPPMPSDGDLESFD